MAGSSRCWTRTGSIALGPLSFLVESYPMTRYARGNHLGSGW